MLAKMMKIEYHVFEFHITLLGTYHVHHLLPGNISLLEMALFPTWDDPCNNMASYFYSGWPKSLLGTSQVRHLFPRNISLLEMALISTWDDNCNNMASYSYSRLPKSLVAQISLFFTFKNQDFDFD